MLRCLNVNLLCSACLNCNQAAGKIYSVFLMFLGMNLHHLILILFYVNLTYGAAHNTTDIRLPHSISPEHYKLKVLTHLNDTNPFQFKGEVFITVN